MFDLLFNFLFNLKVEDFHKQEYLFSSVCLKYEIAKAIL
jgi:hypothetical protein